MLAVGTAAAPAPAAEEVVPEPELAPAPELATQAEESKPIVRAAGPEPKTPGELCPTNYFKTQKMWEISWGRQYSDTNGTTTFTMASNGGLKFLNDQPLPSYFKNNFRWLYVNDPVADRTVKYGFADGTVTTVEVNTDCIPPQPDAIVDVVATNTLQRDLRRVQISTVTTTTGFVLDVDKWVKGQPVVSDPVITYRDATEADFPTAALPADVSVADAGAEVKSEQVSAGAVSGVLPDTGAPPIVLAVLGALLLGAGGLLLRKRA